LLSPPAAGYGRRVARKYVFCGNPANSKEDAFPLWLNEIGPGEGDLTHARSGGSWNTRGFDVKVRQVCSGCNNEWMSEMESRTKPLLVPFVLATRTAPIAPREQISIATWAFKTAIMLALAHPIEEPFVPLEDYSRFYIERKPPANTWIWVAGLVPIEGEVVRVAWSQPRQLKYTLHRKGVCREKYGYRLAFSVGSLVIEVIREPIRGKLERPREARDMFTRIRPVSPGKWPPGLWLSPAGLDDLVEGEVHVRKR